MILTLEFVSWILYCVAGSGLFYNDGSEIVSGYSFQFYWPILFWLFYMVPSSLVFFTLLFSSLQNQLLGMTVKTSRALRFTVLLHFLPF